MNWFTLLLAVATIAVAAVAAGILIHDLRAYPKWYAPAGRRPRR
jgi:hypothetical protein